ncbi:hypothetical protein MHYP_G00016850 [Metynnis hypsauchen]
MLQEQVSAKCTSPDQRCERGRPAGVALAVRAQRPLAAERRCSSSGAEALSPAPQRVRPGCVCVSAQLRAEMKVMVDFEDCLKDSPRFR